MSTKLIFLHANMRRCFALGPLMVADAAISFTSRRLKFLNGWMLEDTVGLLFSRPHICWDYNLCPVIPADKTAHLRRIRCKGEELQVLHWKVRIREMVQDLHLQSHNVASFQDTYQRRAAANQTVPYSTGRWNYSLPLGVTSSLVVKSRLNISFSFCTLSWQPCCPLTSQLQNHGHNHRWVLVGF